jgi:thiol-disulfide isomerase/thioredoxin
MTLLLWLLTAGSVGAFLAPPSTSIRPLALVRPQQKHQYQKHHHQHPSRCCLSMSLDNTFADPSSSNRTSTSTSTTATNIASESTTEAQFGDVVSRSSRGSTAPTNTMAQFGDTVSMTDRPSATAGAGAGTAAAAADDSNSMSDVDVAAGIQRRNSITAVLSIALALTNYLWQLSHPITPIQLLMSMQVQSDSITLVGSNNKPTVVDFWAPWCENCKLTAPTLQQVEEEYKDRVNFVMIDGDKEAAWPYIEAFGVDAIPHLALVSAKGDVETALIGPIPKHVLEADLDVLIRNAAADQPSGKELPYTMLDVFANKPGQSRRLHFDK